MKEKNYELIATATFGLEAVVKREIEEMGYEIIGTENGKVTYRGDAAAIARSNLWLRSADRVFLKMGEFKAETFEELFQNIKKIDWHKVIPVDGKFDVTGNSVKSKLHSVPACQSIIKKASSECLGEAYMKPLLPETGAEYRIQFQILKDHVMVGIDTSGAGLHKRGYRIESVPAPIKETLAAALVNLSFWNKEKPLIDTCCGSGTIPIEAALIGRNIAPGLNRSFASEDWEIVPEEIWKAEKKRAYSMIDYDAEIDIKGFDIDSRAIAAAEENAIEAGVDDCIVFERKDVRNVEVEGEYGVIITNPPYGERIGEAKEIKKIYKALRRIREENSTWSVYIITSDKASERAISDNKADRRRKLYNGRLEVCYYQFHGEKPLRKKRPE